jgi:hypothetical protein
VRWDAVAEHLRRDSCTAAALREQRRFGPIRLQALHPLPEGTDDEIGWMLNGHC